MKNWMYYLIGIVLLVVSASQGLTTVTPIDPQSGHDIVCTGPNFTYQHDVRQHGVDSNLAISGDAGLIVETNDPYASAYVDRTFSDDPAVFEYSFTAEAGKLLGDVTVSSRTRVWYTSNIIIGEYKIGDGSWIEFLRCTDGEVRRDDVFENIYDTHFRVRYTVSWIATNYSSLGQLFRSWGPEQGQPGDYAFTFTASLVENTDCHKADLTGETVLIDLADFAVLASDYGLTGEELAGDIDGDGDCDLADVQWMLEYWLCDCYTSCG